ncbi:MAG TPA: LysR family transcriptional regulator [Polyangiaceae bacterium]|nr:LysR family transcriptional regulator [Polyangiaceae bacterium]
MTKDGALALDWDQVRLFLAVVRERSLAGAAARLRLDVSTVSRRLDRLEDGLGAPLFDRTRDGTTPTALAEQLVDHAEAMERSASRFAAGGALVETRVEGTVRLTVLPGIADAFVAPVLAELHARHPGLVIELDASVPYADLTRREADIAIRATRPTSGDLVTTKLVSAPAVPMTSPGYAAELGRVKRLEDARWLSWAADLAHLPDAVWLRTHGPGVVPVLRTSHYASQLAAARGGLGIVIASAPFASEALVPVRHAKSLAAAWAALPTSTLWLVGHRALRNVPRVAAVWAFILERIGRAD